MNSKKGSNYSNKVNFVRNNGANSVNKMNSNMKKNVVKGSSVLKKMDRKKLMKYLSLILGLIVLLTLVYIVIYLIKYLSTKCYKKHSFIDYLRNGSLGNVCLQKDAPLMKKMENKPIKTEEVFHIANQDYNYNQAKCKCSAYGARLAKYSEIVDAYNKGANWCNYGWSEGQKAYYPVQKCYWDNSKEFCGKKPGINGGFFPNPHLKFGVNCFGVKPEGKVVIPKEPVCDEHKDFCGLKKNKQASTKLDSDDIAPFNKTQWSIYMK